MVEEISSVVIGFPRRSEIEEKIFQQWMVGKLDLNLLKTYFQSQNKSVSLLPYNPNQEILEWLDKFASIPDDKGEKWWSEFNRELEKNRLNLSRGYS